MTRMLKPAALILASLTTIALGQTSIEAENLMIVNPDSVLSSHRA